MKKPPSTARRTLGTLLVSGGVGNLWDRALRQGRVTDFLNPGVGPFRSGIFNVADLALSLGVVLLLVSAARDARAAPSPTADAAAVRAVLDKQVEAWNRNDLEGFMAGYWNSPDLVFQSGANVTRGWEATRERYRRRYQAEGKEMGRLRFEDLDVQPLSPDAAFVRGRWRLTMKDGSEPNGLFTLLLRRIGREWKVVHDHTS